MRLLEARSTIASVRAYAIEISAIRVAVAVIHRSDERSCSTSATTAAILSALVATVLLAVSPASELTLAAIAALLWLALTGVLWPRGLLVARLRTASTTAAAATVTV